MKTEFRDIYEEYYLKVFRYIYKKTSHFQTAEDLTQDIFLSCLRNYDRYDPGLASLNTWIFVITDNRLKNYYRSQKNCLSRYSKDDPAELVSEDYAEQAVLLEERRSMLLDIIDSLSGAVGGRTEILSQEFIRRDCTGSPLNTGKCAGNTQPYIVKASSPSDPPKLHLSHLNAFWMFEAEIRGDQS